MQIYIFYTFVILVISFFISNYNWISNSTDIKNLLRVLLLIGVLLVLARLFSLELFQPELSDVSDL